MTSTYTKTTMMINHVSVIHINFIFHMTHLIWGHLALYYCVKYGGGGGRLCSEFRLEATSYRSRSGKWSNEYDISSFAKEHLCLTELYFLFRFHLS